MYKMALNNATLRNFAREESIPLIKSIDYPARKVHMNFQEKCAQGVRQTAQTQVILLKIYATIDTL